MDGNPNDKAMREKLQAAEYPYDPAAWGAMEQLLDARRKRRAFLWWTSLSLVAALLVTAGLYIGTHASATDKNAITGTHHSSRMRANEKSNEAAQANNDGYANTTSRNSAQANATHRSNTSVSSPDPKLPADNTAGNTSPHSSANMLIADAKKQQEGNGAKPLSKKQRRASGAHAAATGGRNNFTNKTTHSTTYPATSALGQTLSLSRPLFNTEEIEVAMSPIHAVSYTCLYDDQEDAVPVIPLKHRRKISIRYSLGIEAGAYAGYVAKTWADKPTWALGMSQQLMIGKYFAITNSILYSEVNFKVDKPNYPYSDNFTLNGYRSHIREIAIPIGIKVYSYASKLIKVGIGISYVNHIKLKETFDYDKTVKVPSSVNTPTGVADYGNFPQFNTFVPTPDQSGGLQANDPHTSALADYYSIGKGRRYYGSMAYTAGIEVMLPGKFSIAAEPCFLMSLDKIKMQNSRVFDFGMNAGVKYNF